MVLSSTRLCWEMMSIGLGIKIKWLGDNGGIYSDCNQMMIKYLSCSLGCCNKRLEIIPDTVFSLSHSEFTQRVLEFESENRCFVNFF